MSEVVVEACDPRDRERQIRDLFARNGKSFFDTVFERAYRARADRGLRSWIALSDDRAVMHISVTPMPFVGCGRRMTAGILGDLMVDESHRDFWAPVRLLRRMVSDVKREGRIDFLITTTVADAEAVFKAGGFKPFASLRRYVLPLVLPYLTFTRIRSRARRNRVRAGDGTVPRLDEGLEVWRPYADREFYDTRIPRAEFSDANWLALNGGSATATAALLSRNQDLPLEMSFADLFWTGNRSEFPEIVHASARWARQQGMKKLSLTTLAESAVARRLEQAGFMGRDTRSKLLIHGIGPDPVPPVEEWFLPSFGLSGW